MQPESDISSLPAYVISADGKCTVSPDQLRQLAEVDAIEHLDIIIDANQLLGSPSPITVLGQSSVFLSQSRHFKLRHIEPLNDGRCIVRYIKKTTKKNPS